MKILKWVGISLVSVIALALIAGLFLEKEYKVERTLVIKTDKATVINKLKSLKEFQLWSPWAELDPGQKNTFEGTDGEVGSKQHWEGNEDVGKGTMTITNINESRVDYDLKFIEPFESDSKSYYIAEETDGGVKVTWGMTGANPYPMNVMTAMMDMDGMIGKDFEKGLNKLKSQLEK